MLPFAQHIQNQPPRGTAPLHHQQVVPGGGTNSMLPNLMQFQPQMGFMNPQLPTSFNNNVNMGNVGRPPAIMNMPNYNALQQNNNLFGGQGQPGFFPQNFGQNSAQLYGQFGGGWQNGMNQQQLGNMGVMLNPAQVAALAQLIGCATGNQGGQGGMGMVPQSGTAFFGNPNQQLGVLQPNGGMQQQGGFGQQLLPVGSQQLQNVPNPAAFSNQQNGQWPNSQMQGNHGRKQGMHTSNSNHHQNKNFMKNNRREASKGRFQKSQDHHMRNAKGKHKSQGTRSLKPADSADQSTTGKIRTPSFFYTEKEVRKWREERKKNFPTEAIQKKKLLRKQASADAAEEEAKLRRQELKDIVAKQVELGFEVPEIPSHLLGNEDQFHGKDQKKRPSNNGQLRNKFGKRGRFDIRNQLARKRGRKDNGSLKKHEHVGKRECVENAIPSMQPTLLQKLMSTDIKRDRSRLLQAIRFVVMNSFFKEHEKPLNFPKVIIKETSDDDASNGDDGENDGTEEEGEITD